MNCGNKYKGERVFATRLIFGGEMNSMMVAMVLRAHVQDIASTST